MMETIEYDDVSNKAIARHLNEQDEALKRMDAALADLRQLLEESVADRQVLHAKIDEIAHERARLVAEYRAYQQAMEERMKTVEARGDLRDIRAAVQELVDANRPQLALHRWWTHHKIKSRLTVAVTGAAMAAITGAAGGICTTILHHFHFFGG